eukprot:s8097_g4.t2
MEVFRSRFLAPRLFRAWLGGLWSTLVEEGPAEDGAPKLRGGGASFSCGGAVDARGGHRRMLPGLPRGALPSLGVTLVVPRRRAGDERKTKALIDYAPPGSCVLRIGHTARDLKRTKNSREVVVDTWSAGQERTLMHVGRQVAQAILGNWGNILGNDVYEHLCNFVETDSAPDLHQASKFASEAVRTSDIETRKTRVIAFLEKDLKFSKKGIQALARKFPRIWGISVMKPTVAWLEDVGLSRQQVTKVVAGFPSVLGYSIDGNLKPTVAWLEDVGLSQQQVAKVVAGFPSVLGYSIDANLKPTVAWLEGVGLSRRQVAKVVAGFAPVLGCSIEGNLKPTVAWLEDVGLSRQQVAKVVAVFPSVLGCSIEGNLKPTVAWLEDVGLSREQVAKVVAGFPAVLSYSIENNLSKKYMLLRQFFSKEDICSMIVYLPQMLSLGYARLFHRLKVLLEHGCSYKLARVMALTDAKFAQRFPSFVDGTTRSIVVAQKARSGVLLMIPPSHSPFA